MMVDLFATSVVQFQSSSKLLICLLLSEVESPDCVNSLTLTEALREEALIDVVAASSSQGRYVYAVQTASTEVVPEDVDHVDNRA